MVNKRFSKGRCRKRVVVVVVYSLRKTGEGPTEIRPALQSRAPMRQASTTSVLISEIRVLKKKKQRRLFLDGRGCTAWWLGSLVVRALSLRLDGFEFDSRRPQLVLRWVFHLWVRKPPQYFTEPPTSTQPPTLSGTENEYQPKCGDVLRLGSKGRYGSFHFWINVWVAGKIA